MKFANCRWLAVPVLCMATACGGQVAPKLCGTNTNWLVPPTECETLGTKGQFLQACFGAADCDGLACICGVCTRSCVEENECGGGTCGALSSNQCGLKQVPASNVCVVECSDSSGCPGDLECREGQCLPWRKMVGDEPGSASTGSVCVDSMCEFPGETAWHCLAEEAPPSSVDSRQVRLIVPITNAVSGKPLVGLAALVCATPDVECLQPVAEAVADENGKLNIRLDAGFNGYLRFDDPDVKPTLFFLSRPIAQDVVVALALLPSDTGNVVLQVPLDPERELIDVFVKDCDGSPGVGVTLSSPDGDEQTTSLYSVDGRLFFSDTIKRTGENGLGQLMNLPRGIVRVVGRLEDGTEVATGTAILRGDYRTVLNLYPSLGLSR